ncbi:MAG: hypothetical protein PWQ25_1795 [Deferribacteres bacterium]|nr:hypothetical protein [Deferribacteraceae bacterium]MDK2792932.1 hypothetical protein [Deferribacteres bacterium]
MKRLIVAVLAVMVMFSSFGFAETRGAVVMKDTAYGAITGAIIGAAFLAFEEKPSDHLEYISYGAAGGAIVGAIFGVYEATALVEIENGKTKIAMPTIKTQVKGIEKVASTDVLKVKF